MQTQAVPNLINLIIAVDMSGSMLTRWESVQRGVFEAANMLSAVDCITIIPFNESVVMLGPAPKAAFPFRDFFSITPSGGTHLYDAILQSFMVGLQLHIITDRAVPIPRTTYMVVMTDGDDQGSRTSLAELCVAVARVNSLTDFKIIFAGVDLPPDGRRALETLGSIGDRDIQFMDMRGGSFDGVFQHLRILLSVRRTQA